MSNLITLTPHDGSVEGADGSLVTFQSVGKARVVAEAVQEVAQVDGIPLVSKQYLEPVGLPPRKDGTLLIVSYYTRACCPERDDLLVPHDLVRDAGGWEHRRLSCLLDCRECPAGGDGKLRHADD